MKNKVCIYPLMTLGFLLIFTSSCKKEEEKKIPILTTSTANAITTTTAISGGDVISDGGVTITERGICYSTNQSPTIAAHSKVTATGTTGIFTSSITGLTSGSKYCVRAYATNSVGTAYGNEVSFITTPLPNLTTTAATAITFTTATSGGNIINDGNATITERGVCYSTTQSPTIASSKVAATGTTGNFTCSITGLTAGSTYNVRAYATNSVGTAYGNEINFTTDPLVVNDSDGNIYNVIRIGTQLWMKENLKTTKYRNGHAIPNITDNTAWTTQTAGAYCFYKNDIANKATYGALYNYYAVVDSRSLCPTGWHVATDAEWITLTDYLTNNGYGFGGSGSDIGKSLAATSGWAISGTAGAIGNDQASNNSSGFTALPGGYRYDSGGGFYWIGACGNWWSFAQYGVTFGWYREMICGYSDIKSYHGDFKNRGYSVRCIRD